MIWRLDFSDHEISFFKYNSIICTCSRWCSTDRLPLGIPRLSICTPIWLHLETAHIYPYPFFRYPEVETLHQFLSPALCTELAAVEQLEADSCLSWNSCRTSSEFIFELFHFWPTLKRPFCAYICSWWSPKWGSTRRSTPLSLRFPVVQLSWFFMSNIFQ